MKSNPFYTESVFSPSRRKTRVVRVGFVPIGGDYPIVLQSMTTTPTMDTLGTVEQIRKLQEVGCEIVRITTPTINEAKNLENIRREMEKQKIEIPLVADVHFLPQVAMEACNWVEKVRVNPGNFADRKRFEVKEYSDIEYELELQRLYDAFAPIVRKAQSKKIAIRIGTNHGSLSDRIMNRYGDTPHGMVESALEFIRIAQKENFHDLVISMKSSNPFVMVQAYRMLVSKMNEFQMDYPLHLGVTEAGNGPDGRVKSSIGIASLLSDGLGDTIRVSLTEDPEFEIPVAKKITQHFTIVPLYKKQPVVEKDPDVSWDFYNYRRRKSDKVEVDSLKFGGDEIIPVFTHVSQSKLQSTIQNGEAFDPELEVVSVDFQVPSKDLPTAEHQNISKLLRIQNFNLDASPLIRDPSYHQVSIRANETWAESRFAEKLIQLIGTKMLWIRCEKEPDITHVVSMIQTLDSKIKVGVEIAARRIIFLGRKMITAMDQASIHSPVLLRWVAAPSDSEEDVVIQASNEIGALLGDGIGDCVEVSASDPQLSHDLGFTILQATRLRMSRADYIACPSCGRTLFDLQSTTARIKSQTDHLKGVKIAIMGCIVNGPGEMADADFGYVGSGPGHINLYVGKECVERSIPQEQADQRLIELIKDHGKWVEPSL